MIELKRILFPCRHESCHNMNKSLRLQVKEAIGGTKIDSLASVHQRYDVNSKKVRRDKRHRDILAHDMQQNKDERKKKGKKSHAQPSQMVVLPSRCVRIVMDSLASMGKRGDFPKEISPVVAQSTRISSFEQKLKGMKRARRAKVRKSKRKYLKALKDSSGVMNMTASTRLKSGSTTNEKTNLLVKGNMDSRDGSNIIPQSIGLGTMFGILVPLYPRPKTTKKAQNINLGKGCPITSSKIDGVVPPNIDLLGQEGRQSLEQVEAESKRDMRQQLGRQSRQKTCHNATNATRSLQIAHLDHGRRIGPGTQSSKVPEATRQGPNLKDQIPTDTIHKTKAKMVRRSTRKLEAHTNTTLVESRVTKKCDPSSLVREVDVHLPQITNIEPKLDIPNQVVTKESASIETTDTVALRRSKRRRSTDMEKIQSFKSTSVSVSTQNETAITIAPTNNSLVPSPPTTRRSVASEESMFFGSEQDVQPVLAIEDTGSSTKASKDNSELPKEIGIRRSRRQIIPPDRLGQFCNDEDKHASVKVQETKRESKTAFFASTGQKERRQSDKCSALRPIKDAPSLADCEPTDAHGWTENELCLLRKAHQEVNPTSTAFWEEISERVGSKSAMDCRERWFSYARTPAPVTRKASNHVSAKGLAASTDDDIFNATPMRSLFQISDLFGSSFRVGDHEGLAMLGVGSAVKVSTDNGRDDSTPSLKRIRHGYKAYIKNVKRDVKNSLNDKVPKRIQQRSKNKILSFKDTEGDFEVKGRLSPGGTVRMDTESSEVDGMFLSENEDEF